MTRPDLDRYFSDLYPCLVRVAERIANKEVGADIVHAVYCQVVTSESFRQVEGGKKQARTWLECRIALQARSHRRDKNRQSTQFVEEGLDDE